MAYESEPMVLIGESTAQRIHELLLEGSFAAAMSGQPSMQTEVHQLRHVLCTPADVDDLVDAISDQFGQARDAAEWADIAQRLSLLARTAEMRSLTVELAEEAVV